MPEKPILIVEDNERNLELLRDVLEVKGFVTIEARTAYECLGLAVRDLPALILMDIQLPDMDGLTVLQRLKEDPLTSEIPVIAVTAFAMPGDRGRFLAAGFDGYMVKPVDIKKLPEFVRAFVSGDRSRAGDLR